jgi:hypothetical protein
MTRIKWIHADLQIVFDLRQIRPNDDLIQENRFFAINPCKTV